MGTVLAGLASGHALADSAQLASYGTAAQIRERFGAK